jgi:hypothetical protein
LDCNGNEETQQVTTSIIGYAVFAALVAALLYLGWRIILGWMILWSVLNDANDNALEKDHDDTH